MNNVYHKSLAVFLTPVLEKFFDLIFITNLLYYYHNGGFFNIKQGLIIF